jgi:DNA-binding transcriptional regulator YhcF (GntR family)
MAVREVAESIEVSYRTVAKHVKELFPEIVENGKTTYLDEKQVTVLLEKMKMEKSSGSKSNLVFQMQGMQTALSPILQLKMLQEQMNRIYDAEIARLQADLAATTRLLERRTAGLETIQRIAEAGGLIMSDRDDLYSAYRGRS